MFVESSLFIANDVIVVHQGIRHLGQQCANMHTFSKKANLWNLADYCN